VADDADFGFAVFFWPAKDEFLLGRKFVAGKNAGAVKAEENVEVCSEKTRPSRSEPMRRMGFV